MIKSRVKTKDGEQKITAYNTKEFPYPVLNFRKLRRNWKYKEYAAAFMCLDTETSHDNLDRAWIYQAAIKFKNLYWYGRTPSDIIEFLETTCEHYQLSDDKKIIIYIQNASYDLQYLKEFLFAYDPGAEFFAIDAHTVLICDVIGFRIICSWKLTNLSLNALAEKYAVKYRKAAGEIDYSLVRYQDDDLTDSDWFYMFSDVAAQYDGVTQYLKMNGYRYAYNAPFTSTGFVRAECRRAALAAEDWRDEFEKSALDLEQFRLCRAAFMGGICIASFQYAGVTIRSDKLRHLDFASSYPARQMLDYFPAGAPMWYGDLDDPEEFEDLLENNCCVFMATFHDLKIKKGVTAPYIPSSKCYGVKEVLRVNGKVVFAERLSIAITEIDLKWIRRQYNYSGFEVRSLLVFERGPVPDWLKSQVMSYYRGKCELKGVDDLLYSKSKNMLNGIYGMTATSILRDTFKMTPEHVLEKKIFDDPDAEDQKEIARYYRSYNSFMPYQFSLYTTAHARDALMTMIEVIGYENFIYCDTDSAFYLETDENRESMASYKTDLIEKAKGGGAFIGSNYLGAAEDEAPIRAIRALHAKCYAIEEEQKDGTYKLNVVIAGIPKASIKWINGEPVKRSNAEELGDIDNLKDGFVFRHNGGTRAIYIEGKPRRETINGHVTELAGAVIIENIEKEISEMMYSIEAGHLLNFAQSME